MKVLFMGTPDFAVPCIEILIKNGYDVCAAVTQPDKPRGRGHKLTPPPVKSFALDNGIPVCQPEGLKNGELADVLAEHNPDIIIVVAYGKILPEYILNYPKYGCVNVHASLLPKYRGAAPIQWSVINGDEKTGVTTMYMEKGLDTGDMILKSETHINSGETYGELHDRLSEMGAELLLKTVKEIENGTVKREKQDDSLSCYAPMIFKETGHIDWEKSNKEVLNLINGTNPYPGSYAMYGDTVVKIFKAELCDKATGAPGEFKIEDKKLKVNCGDGGLLISEVQFKGSRRMTVESYLNGHEIDESIILK